MALLLKTDTNADTGRPINEGLLDVLSAQAYEYFIRYLGQYDGQKVWFAGQRIHDLKERTEFYALAVAETEKMLGESVPGLSLDAYQTYKTEPVSVRQFICDPYYLNKEKEVYPAVMAELEELNSGKYVEAVLTGGIGSGKTTTALYTQAYQVYLLSCMRNAHVRFELDPSSEILIIFQSINQKLAKGVDYNRFRDMIQQSKYFKEKYPFKKDVESKLVFPNRIEVVPVSGAETAAIGQNVIGGIIDELNYMAVVEKSKQSADHGTYDQAVQLYNSIARRRKSRFMQSGKLPGILCLVSSKKYPGQFTDTKQDEARTDKTIFVYDKRIWDIAPSRFKSGWFHVFVGDETRKPRVLEKDEEVPDADRELVMAVPNDFRNDFDGPRADIINALREIAGVSTMARHPYFSQTELVNESMGEHASIFSTDQCDFVHTKVAIVKGNIWRPELPRFAHIDLAISGDSAGVCIGTVRDFVSMKSLQRGEEDGMMPRFHIDGVLEIKPPKDGEILFWKIREMVVKLRDKAGINVRWVTLDSFESTDSQQLLRQQGFVSGLQSMDVLPCKPYDFLKSAVYDGRVSQPMHKHLRRELLQLERDLKTGKIDHPPAGSKDCADALAGVVFGLTMRREIWGMFKVPLVMIPSNVTAMPDKLTEKNAKLAEQAQKAEEESLSEWDRVILRKR